MGVAVGMVALFLVVVGLVVVTDMTGVVVMVLGVVVVDVVGAVVLSGVVVV